MPRDYAKICRENLDEYGKGTRHLAFLSRLYSERTHFIFELLQNAEDAHATRVKFDLKTDRLEVWHDGRLFNEKDVRGVCGIAEGTKGNDLTQIGKFGIGFKSVYAFTLRPEIHCGDEHFAIENYIRPQTANSVDIPAPWTTLFTLPFNRPDLAPEVARGEIAQRLANLKSRTMLFLRHIRDIEWSSPDGATGCYVRQETPYGPARRVAVIGETAGQKEEETWLILEAPVFNEASQNPLRVEAAFNVVRDNKTGREAIFPVNDSNLSVFFPTEKPTRLGHLIQGPYRTTPARDNVPKDDGWNGTLIAATAALVASTLCQLRELGLLTVGALETMPIRSSDFPPDSMFRPIFDAVSDVLESQALIPTVDGTFVSASHAKLARGSGLRELFDPAALASLLTSPVPLLWVSAEITSDGTPDLHEYFRETLGVEELTPETVIQRLTKPFLESRSDDWMIRLCNFLDGQKALLWRVKYLPIVRLQDGTHVSPLSFSSGPAAYLSSQAHYDDVPLVKSVFLENETTRAFLKKLGIDDFDVFADFREKILPRYRAEGSPVENGENERHIRQLSAALTLRNVSSEKRSELMDLACESPIVRSRNAVSRTDSYRKPGEVYYESDDLAMYFADNPAAWFLSADYPKDLAECLEQLGVARTIRIQTSGPFIDQQGHAILSANHGSHERGIDRFDPDFDVDGLRHAVSHPTAQRSVYVWEKIARPHNRQVQGVVEKSSYKDFRNKKSGNSYSKMGKALSDCAWLPHDGRFVKPATLSLDDLPEVFSRDEVLASRLQMKVDEVAALARKAGVDVEMLTLAKQLANDQDLCAQVRKWIDAKANKPEFPSRPTPNPQRRSEHVSRDAETAPEKTYEDRHRSVRTSEPAQDPSALLLELYTNPSGQMVCQICEKEMPFKKRDGQYYFEAVEALSTLSKELQPLYLALCPVCAAKYKEFVKRDETASQRVSDAIVAAPAPRVPLQFGGEAATLRFVDSHFLDIRTVIGGRTTDHPKP